MEFNILKCTILQITLRQKTDHFDYKMHNITLKRTDQHSYLGICLNHKLSWSPHVSHLCNKANRLLGFLHRNLRNSPRHIKETAYKQLILPVLQYCSSIWDPHQKYLIHKLEMVQHRAARFVLNKPWKRNDQDSITQLLQQLNWPTLKTQRRHARLILLYKVINNILIIPSEYLPTPSSSVTRAQHTLRLLLYQTFIDTYLPVFFFPRTVPQWNSLTICNVDEIDIETFKRLLTDL